MKTTTLVSRVLLCGLALFALRSAVAAPLPAVPESPLPSVGFTAKVPAGQTVANWHDQATWAPANVPGPLAHVRIPAGVTVTFSSDITVRTLRVEGVLKAVQNSNSTLTSRWVMVHGPTARFEVGTPTVPFTGTFTLSLIGDESDTVNIMGSGTKFLMAMDGGSIDLHGEAKTSWTRLAQTAAATSTSIVVRGNTTGWKTTDKIVIATTDHPRAAVDLSGALRSEVRTINTITRSGGNTTITFNDPLDYDHVGKTRTFTRATPAKTWTLEQRAEVGVLTRNIKVQGIIGTTPGNGGHIMIMRCGMCGGTGGFGRFSNIELFNMGQKQRLGRYPIHWHMLGDEGLDQYIKNSAIWSSFNRATTLHGTNRVLVSNNVMYDHLGHGMFLEDGSERFNVIENNVVLHTRKPAPGEQILETDNAFADNANQNRSPASFWITNPQNTFRGNVAAGTVGTAYWFAFPDNPTGLSSTDARFQNLTPRTLPLVAFEDNMSHSVMSGFDINDSLNNDTEVTLRKNVGYEPANPQTFSGQMAYACDAAIYTGLNGDFNMEFIDGVFADNVEVLTIANTVPFINCAFVASSALAAGEPASEDLLGNIERAVHRAYDGEISVANCHIVGYNSATRKFLAINGGATKHLKSEFSGLTFSPNQKPHFANVDHTSGGGNNNPLIWTWCYKDVDGSLTRSGIAGRRLIPNMPILTLPTDVPYINTDGTDSFVRITTGRPIYARVALYNGPNAISRTALPDMEWTRIIGTNTPVFIDEGPDETFARYMPLIANLADSSHYILRFYNPGTTNPYSTAHNLISVPLGDLNPAVVGGTDNDHLIIRIPGLAVGRTVKATSGANSRTGSWPVVTSLALLRASTTNAVFIAGNGDFWIHWIHTGTAEGSGFSIYW